MHQRFRIKLLPLLLLAAAFLLLPAVQPAAAAVKKLTASETKLDMFVGQIKSVEITATMDDGSELDVTSDCTWTSSSEGVASADAGQVIAFEKGKASITAEYEGKKVKISVNVLPEVIRVEADSTTLTLTKGASKTPAIYAVYGTGKNDRINVNKLCEWDNSDEDVISLTTSGTGAGRIKALANGSATVTAFFNPYDDNRFAPVSITVNVVPPVKELKVPQTSLVLTGGSRVDFPVTAVFTDGSELDVTDQAVFSVSNKSVAAYDSGGITALAPGSSKATISFAGKKKVISINVLPDIGGLTIKPSELTDLKPGQVKAVKAWLTHSKGQLDVTGSATWDSSDENVARVSGGRVTAVGPGTAAITAAFQDRRATITVTVNKPVNSLIPSIQTTSSSPLALVKDDPSLSMQQVNITAVYSDTSQVDVTDRVTWRSSNERVARVITAGLSSYITAQGNGTAVITASMQGKTATIYVKVTAPVSQIYLDSYLFELEEGGSKTIKVTAEYSDGSKGDITGECTFISQNTDIATVEKGVVRGLKEGRAYITVKYGDRLEKTAIAEVKGKIRGVAIFLNEEEVHYLTVPRSQPLYLSLKGKRSDEATAAWVNLVSGVTWTSSNKSVADVDATGRVEARSAGRALIMARIGGLSALLDLTVADTLISGITPARQTAGNSFDLTISGLNTSFSALSRVYVGNQLLPLKSVSANQIVVTIPSGLLTVGKHDVKVITGTEEVLLKEGLTIYDLLKEQSAVTVADADGEHRLIEVLFNQPIKLANGDSSAGGANGFTVQVAGGSSPAVQSIKLKPNNNRVLILQLDQPIQKDKLVTVYYNSTTPGIVAVQSLLGASLSTFNNLAVANNAPDRTPPMLIKAYTDNQDGSVVYLEFNEPVVLTTKDTKAGFTLNGSAGNIISAQVNATDAKKVELLIKPGEIKAGLTVRIGYDKVVGGFNVQDKAGNKLDNIVDLIATNYVQVAPNAPSGMTISSISLDLDSGTMTIYGSNLQGKDSNATSVVFDKLVLSNANLNGGSPTYLVATGGTSVAGITADSITINLGPVNTDTLQAIPENSLVTFMAQKGWLKAGEAASTDEPLSTTSVTVKNSKPATSELTDALGKLSFNNAVGKVLANNWTRTTGKKLYLDVYLGSTPPTGSSGSNDVRSSALLQSFSGVVIEGISEKPAGTPVWYRLRDKAGQTTAWVQDGVVPERPVLLTTSAQPKGSVSFTGMAAGYTAWLAPAGTTSFTTGNTITFSDSTTIEAPSTPGQYCLFIQGDGGNISAPAQATLSVDSTQPSVLAVGSDKPDGYYKPGDVIDIYVTFSKPVYVLGTPRLTLETGTTDRDAIYLSGSGSPILIFRYTVQSGDQSNDLDYTGTGSLVGVIKDAASNPAVLTLPQPGQNGSLSYNKEIKIDTTPPSISGVSSAAPNGTYKTGDIIPITVQFSEIVFVTGTPTLELTVGNNVYRNIEYVSGSGTNRLRFDYVVQSGDYTEDLDYNGTNALKLGTGDSIVDKAGNNANINLPINDNGLKQNKDIAIKPSILNVSQLANGSSKPGTIEAGDMIILVFSEEMDTTAIGTLFDITISNDTSNVITVQRAVYNDVLVTITATGQQYNVGSDNMTCTANGVWSNNDTTLTITLGTLSGGQANSNAVNPNTATFTAGPAAVDKAGNPASTAQVTGALGSF